MSEFELRPLTADHRRAAEKFAARIPPGERAFIDWIVAAHPGFAAIHFHSTRTLRHGFTLIQRQRPLS